MKTLGINSHNVVVSLIVRGLANSKKIDNAIWVLDLMLEMQIIPIVDTFTTLMHVYYKEAYVTKALELKSIMEDCHVKLGVVAYNVLISSLYTNSCASYEQNPSSWNKGTFDIPEVSNAKKKDILATAIGQPEHSGRVCAVGLGVTIS
ncbi:hypothetical protein JHK86_042923 [Glycine max]|nr:hypothetical protein JHK86_042923 [Glycine max]